RRHAKFLLLAQSDQTWIPPRPVLYVLVPQNLYILIIIQHYNYCLHNNMRLSVVINIFFYEQSQMNDSPSSRHILSSLLYLSLMMTNLEEVVVHVSQL
ncbi:unnamed protein product, partial [Heterosigma akashiwo]